MADPAAEKITLDQVRHVVRLALLAMVEGQLRRLTPHLQSHLEDVAKIGEVAVADVDPMAHATPLHNVLRNDTPGQPLPLEQVLANAPDTDGPFFKVPKIIGGEEDSAG